MQIINYVYILRIIHRKNRNLSVGTLCSLKYALYTRANILLNMPFML